MADDLSELPSKMTDERASNYVGTFLSSAASAGISRLLLHPIDTVKALMQVQIPGAGGVGGDGIYRNKKFFSVARHAFRNHGFSAFYQGIGVAWLGSIPGNCLYFTSYEYFRNHFGRYTPISPLAVDFSAGFAAEAVSCVIWVPVDICKERLQTQNELKVSNHRGSLDALRNIIRKEGITQLYKGYWATLASFGPMSAIYFMSYEQCKKVMNWIKNDNASEAITHSNSQTERLPFVAYLSSGLISGATAAWVTNPLDIVKLRLQVQKGGNTVGGRTPFYYRSFMHGLSCLFHQEGLRGAFRGSGARVAYHTPSMAITMTLVELVRDFLAGKQE